MPILSERIASSAKGSLMEREDWWRLCYDTENCEFFVEHEWDHVNPYKIGVEPGNSGKARYSVETWQGEGAEKIEEAKRILLAKAGL